MASAKVVENENEWDALTEMHKKRAKNFPARAITAKTTGCEMDIK